MKKALCATAVFIVALLTVANSPVPEPSSLLLLGTGLLGLSFLCKQLV